MSMQEKVADARLAAGMNRMRLGVKSGVWSEESVEVFCSGIAAIPLIARFEKSFKGIIV